VAGVWGVGFVRYVVGGCSWLILLLLLDGYWIGAGFIVLLCSLGGLSWDFMWGNGCVC